VNAREQFGPRAGEYATSVVHSRGADAAVERLGLRREDIALDVGTGAGHTAHALARRCRFVFASDITPEMLWQAGRLAGDLDLANVQPLFALAEALPFEAASLDAVTCRLAAHHFRDAGAFCAEAARVLAPRGRALFVDVCVPEERGAAAYINDIEVHRDHSHVEDYTASRWRTLVADAGLEIIEERLATSDLAEEELIEWTRRSGTAADDVEYIRRRLAEAPHVVVEAMKLRRDRNTFRWLWPVLTIVAEKPQP
jgi:ubiquinone/menaquinone biosynthesis C-methylase UbiE